VRVGFPQDPGSAGKDVVGMLSRLLAGYSFWHETETGSKAIRATPLGDQVGAGNIAVVRAAWTSPLVEEWRVFDKGPHDDQVDAAARAFNKLARRFEIGVA
jgi:predicted phage terminase large subunit-like protein